MDSAPVLPRDKALRVNLDPSRYGSFAEIGAGQEVVRWFFQAGGAAGTIAKSISAYDMLVSDAIYGKCQRYVCRERLEDMIHYEYNLNHERLNSQRGENTQFFSFADTVSARNFKGTNECHGWLGIRFQAAPKAPPSDIIIHVRMLDNENGLQQEALGIVGVNLIYGAMFLTHDPDALVKSLLDGLSINRIEVDVVDFSGDAFKKVDNRIISLRLVQLGLSGAAMFSASGKVLQPSEFLRKKPILVERGRFRPVTHVNIDMLDSAVLAFEAEDDVEVGESVAIMEITMNNLRTAEGEIDLQDFISRTEVLEATGHTVMVSDFAEYYRLTAYLSRYTQRRIGLVMGAFSIADLFEDHYYDALDGGILESFGRLFKNNVKLYGYPYKDQTTRELVTVPTLQIKDKHKQLYQYLLGRGCIAQLENYNAEFLDIYSHNVLEKIIKGEAGWQNLVPDVVAKKITAQKLFGCVG